MSLGKPDSTKDTAFHTDFFELLVLANTQKKKNTAPTDRRWEANNEKQFLTSELKFNHSAGKKTYSSSWNSSPCASSPKENVSAHQPSRKKPGALKSLNPTFQSMIAAAFLPSLSLVSAHCAAFCAHQTQPLVFNSNGEHVEILFKSLGNGGNTQQITTWG